ncbi:MAG TPA: hypothetical protein VGE21_10835 [Flavobacteriales bacterium]
MLALLLAPAIQAQHVVHLSEQPPLVVPEGLVIDSLSIRFDPHHAIGTVMKGAWNRSDPAFLGTDAQQELRSLLPHASNGTNALHCALRINVLRISDRSGSVSEMAPCALNFDVLAHSDSGIVLLYEYAGTVTTKGGLDATGRHAGSIRNSLQGGIDAFWREWSGGRIEPRVVHGADAHRGLLGTLGYTALMNGSLPKGVYRTFMDFRDQRPDTTLSFEMKPVRNEMGRSLMVRMKFTEGTPYTDVWGFSDGTALFVDLGDRFVRMARGPQWFTAVIPAQEMLDAGTVVAVGFMFGAIGAGILMASHSRAQGPLTTFELDMLTGSLVPANVDPWRPIVCEQVFIHSKHTALDTLVEVAIPGLTTVGLPKNSYHVAEVLASTQPMVMQVRVKDGRSVEFPLINDRLADPQVYLIKVDKSGTPSIDHIKGNLADGVLADRDRMREVLAPQP